MLVHIKIPLYTCTCPAGDMDLLHASEGIVCVHSWYVYVHMLVRMHVWHHFPANSNR